MRRLSDLFDIRTALLIAFIVLKFVLQYHVINPVYDLHRDEYLHLDLGKHLAWGYTSVPPFTSWTSFIILALGGSVFWVKFFPVLWGSLTIVVVWRIIEELKGRLFALLLASTALVFSTLSRIDILYQPNSFDILCWTLVYYALIRYINTAHEKWLINGFLFLALGFLNKYNIIFLSIGLLPAILLTRHRRIFQNKRFYIGAALAVLIVLPNLIWQFTNGFPVIHHMHELIDTQLVHVQIKDFLIGQVLFFFNSLLILIAAFLSFYVYAPFGKYRFVLFSYFFTVIIFLCLRGKAYYALGLYPVLFTFGAVYLEALLHFGWRRYLQPLLLLNTVIAFLFFFKIIFPVLTPQEIVAHSKEFKDKGALRWEDGKDHALPQDFADMLGWRELSHKVDSVYDLCRDRDATIILCDNYGEAGSINYYSLHRNINAVSLDADYINRMPLDKNIKNIISIKQPADEINLSLINTFQSIALVDSIATPYAKENGTKIYLLQEPLTDVNTWLREKIARRRATI
jgi:hypothetical protein